MVRVGTAIATATTATTAGVSTVGAAIAQLQSLGTAGVIAMSSAVYFQGSSVYDNVDVMIDEVTPMIEELVITGTITPPPESSFYGQEIPKTTSFIGVKVGEAREEPTEDSEETSTEGTTDDTTSENETSTEDTEQSEDTDKNEKSDENKAVTEEDEESDEEESEEESEDSSDEEKEEEPKKKKGFLGLFGGDDDEEVALDLDEVFEIDPAMLKTELSKLRAMREATEGSPAAAEKADNFGGGDIEDEAFIDVDEDVLLNALADELGSSDGGEPAAADSVDESRRRRAARRRRMAETRRRRSRATTADAKTAAENRQLKQQLAEMNLFNAKLLYVNKLMQNRNVSSKQQRAIVEALDNAKTIREAKLVFESLSRSVKKSSLKEGNARRVLGSSSKPTRSSGSAITESAQTDRWATLAGIKK